MAHPRVRPTRVALVLAVALFPGAARAQSEVPLALDPETRAQRELQTRQQLEALRDTVRTLQAQRSATQDERQRVLGELRSTELALSASARELQRLALQQSEHEKLLLTLKAEAKALDERLASERAALGALLRSAYAQGQYAPLLPLLAPDQVGARARLLGYHRILNERRAERIASIRADLERSESLRVEQQATLDALAVTHAALDSEAKTLAAARTQRQALVAELGTKLLADADALKALAADERELLKLLERLKDVLADIPKVLAGSEPFAQLRGKLPLPVQGRVLQRFGAKPASARGRASQGLTLGAKAGSEVRTVAYGRVAYADWLRGYGLIIIVDHDDGFLSLYANCEALLRGIGDWVQPGEAIASAGAGGAEQPPGIYFELRRNGAAVDPLPWIVTD